MPSPKATTDFAELLRKRFAGSFSDDEAQQAAVALLALYSAVYPLVGRAHARSGVGSGSVDNLFQ